MTAWQISTAADAKQHQKRIVVRLLHHLHTFHPMRTPMGRSYPSWLALCWSPSVLVEYSNMVPTIHVLSASTGSFPL
jgi:hypothetical protein